MTVSSPPPLVQRNETLWVVLSHLSILMGVGILLIFFLVGFPLLLGLSAVVIVFSIVAAIRGSEGRLYRYPLTLRLIR
jgi:uncharacterized Tic20 family protein